MIKIKRKIIKEEDLQKNPFDQVPNIKSTMDAVAKEIGNVNGPEREEKLAAIVKAIPGADNNSWNNAVKKAFAPEIGRAHV